MYLPLRSTTVTLLKDSTTASPQFEAAYRIANYGWEYRKRKLKVDVAPFKAGEMVQIRPERKNPNMVTIADREYRSTITSIDNLEP